MTNIDVLDALDVGSDKLQWNLEYSDGRHTIGEGELLTPLKEIGLFLLPPPNTQKPNNVFIQ